MRTIFFYVIVLIPCIVYAQFRQDGITLEYNRREAKTAFTEPVYMSFAGAGSTDNDENGRFTLSFNQSKMGDVVGDFQIQIAANDYVLFNRDRLSEWVLTPNKIMEVVVCKQSIIKELVSNFTSSQYS